MKQFNEIYGKVMIEVSPVDIAMLGADVPVVTLGGRSWVEFTVWANKAFSPNLELTYAQVNGAAIIAKVDGCFNEKSASALKASGFTEFALFAEEDYADDGCPLGASLFVNIPFIP